MSKLFLVNDNEITLPRSCTREQAAELHKLLTGRLAQLLDTDPTPERAELGLSEVRELDACGCQLLALFMEHLRRRGITPAPCGLNDELAGLLTLLGFSDALLLRENSHQ